MSIFRRVGVFLLGLVVLLSGCARRPSPTEERALDEESAAAVMATASEPAPRKAATVPVTSPGDALLTAATVFSDEGSLSIPTTFAITRPEDEIQTELASYFIMGTSDPSQPVYFGEEEVVRLGDMGTFGVHVQLEEGRNRFTFRQGDSAQTVVIERVVPSGSGQISAMRQSSLVPAVMSGAQAGGELAVGCVAPSGASVTATFGGRSIQLRQTKEASPGYPANFSGVIPVGTDYEPGVTRPAGQVTYMMSYSGQNTTETSTGQVYVAGEGSRITVEVSGYVGFIYPDTQDLSVFKETVKGGARDYIASQSNGYFELSSGGFIPKEMVAVVEGEGGAFNELSEVDTSIGNRGEVYTFQGSNRPMYDTKITDDTFFFTLYNTAGTPEIDVSGSRLASSATAVADQNSVTYQLPLKGLLWGYDVSYDGDDTVVTLRYQPSLSDSSKPFSGLIVVLDPGHGGEDAGAAGLAGTTGPQEKDINLAHALVTRDLLVSMGAKVIMTRADDRKVSLDERLQLFERCRADFFVSIHHNSVAESTDSNKVNGMEVYYHTGLSRSFSNTMMNNMISTMGRHNRRIMQSYYRVTLLPAAPSLLMELGFMSNPAEYEQAVTRSAMERTALAVAGAIRQSLA